MLIIFPIASLVLIFMTIRKREDEGSPSECWQSSFISASVIWAFILTAATEILSLFNLITFWWISGFWILATIVSGLFYVFTAKAIRKKNLLEADKFSPVLITLLAGVGIVVITVGVISFLSPPNNWDSMVYHSPKVVHWIQNHNVKFYPTYVLRQNHQNPGAEYVIMHLQILSRNDFFANFVQWYAMVGCVIGSWLIAKHLGVNKLGRIFACVFVVSFPMGIMQASSTQTDYIAGFWILCFVYYVLRLRKVKQINWPCYICLGLSLGLAVLVKATAYIYALFFLVWLVLSQLKLFRAKAIVPLSVAAMLVILINAGHYVRNVDLYGHPLGPMSEGGKGAKYSNDIYTPRAFISNVVRNIGVHVTNTPVKQVNSVSYKAAVYLHKLLDIDINEPRTTWGGTRFRARTHVFNDEVDGNPIHILIVFLAYLIMLIFGRVRKSGDVVKYSLVVLGVFLLICFYLRWGPWHSRIHTGLFVLWAPFIAVVFSRILHKNILYAVSAILLLLAIPWLLFCVHRPLIGDRSVFKLSRNQLYFGMPNLKLEESYLHTKDFLKTKKLSQVGLLFSQGDWEYPMLMLLVQDNPGIRFQHVNVRNVSKEKYNVLPFNNFEPDAVIAIKRKKIKEIASTKEVVVNGQVFSKGWFDGPVGVYFRK